MVSVQSLLADALPSTARLLGGEAGLQGQVTWAATMRTRPPAFESLQGGEAVLLSLSALHALQAVESSLTLAKVVESLAEARVSAVLVAGVEGDISSGDLQKAIALADEHALPFIALPRQPPLTDIERDIITSVVSRRGGQDQRATAIYQELLALSLRRAGIQAMIERLMLALQKPVVLEDEIGRVVQSAIPGEATWASQPALEQAIRVKPARPLFVKAGIFQPGTTKHAPLPALVERQELQALGKSRLVTPVRLGAEVVGYCSVIDEAQRLDTLDRLALEQVVPLLALELGRVRELAEVELRLQGDILDDVLEGNGGDQTQVLLRARQLGYDLERTFVVAVAMLPEVEGIAPGERGPEALSDAARRARQLSNEAERHFPGVIVRERPTEVVLLIPVEGEVSGASLPPRLRERLNEFLARLDPQCIAKGLRIGVSRPASTAAELGTRFREARQAVIIGRRVLSQQPLTYFGALGVYRLLFHLYGLEDVRAFYEETLGPLIAYDRRTDSELVQTLEMYFACNGNLSQAAQQLHLHRNSLLYRLERISEVLHADLDDAEIRLALQVALRMRHLYIDESL
jgi:purine catabolism regulator